MAKKLRTCTVMQRTDGKTSVYMVLRGPMCRGGKAFNSAVAEIVGTFTIVAGPLTMPDYRAMTAQHATPEAPAVYWQA